MKTDKKASKPVSASKAMIVVFKTNWADEMDIHGYLCADIPGDQSSPVWSSIFWSSLVWYLVWLVWSGPTGAIRRCDF